MCRNPFVQDPPSLSVIVSQSDVLILRVGQGRQLNYISTNAARTAVA